jgi:IS1 family transposase
LAISNRKTTFEIERYSSHCRTFWLGIGDCSVEAQHLKIFRLENGIEHFSLNITQHIHRFRRDIFAIGSSILEIPPR